METTWERGMLWAAGLVHTHDGDRVFGEFVDFELARGELRPEGGVNV